MSISVTELPLTALERQRIEPQSSEEVEREVNLAIGAAAAEFDDGELGDVCAIAFEQIAELIASKDAVGLGNYIMFLRRQRIADIASRSIYGRVGMIFAKEVEV